MNDTAALLAAQVKERARKIGFPLVGIAPALPPPRSQHLASWLAAGYAGEMAYLARDPARRADPRLVLPDARSIVAVGAPYAPVPAEEAGPERAASARDARPARGIVSAYARGEDYHRLMEARLRALEREIAALVGRARSRVYCDHGPLLERPVAAAAGLGWIGKNTLLLHRGYGSWLFLGVLLTTAELPPDEEEPDRCGTCRRCLDGCPTGAFPAPYVLDARRCISYLTIELRGSIPRELRPLVGTRIFGCDDCQAVCPWTPASPAPDPPLFRPRPDLGELNLVRCLYLSEDEFALHYAATPLARTGRRGLRRNAAVALGNSGGGEAVDPLGRALADPDPLLRAHAAWALGEIARRLGTPQAGRARALLAAAAASESDGPAREEITAALERAEGAGEPP